MWRTRNCFKVIMAVENYAPNRGADGGMKVGGFPRGWRGA